MAGLIWVMRRVRHMIEATRQITVFFTDHAANISITKQTTFANNNIDKFNLRLVPTFIYLSQFRLNVKYRPSKKHVIPNAFSRLSSGNGPINPKLPRAAPSDSLNLETFFCGIINPSKNPDCYIFQNFFVNMSEEFKQQIINGYDIKNIGNKLKDILKGLAKRSRYKKTFFLQIQKTLWLKMKSRQLPQLR